MRALTIGPAYLGLVKTTGYQRHPADSLVDARDVWPTDSKTSRARLAVRPGFATYGTSLAAVNLIHALDAAADENNASPPTYKRQLMIAYAGELYKNTGVGSTFTQVGDADIIDTGRNVQATSYGNSLYIANTTAEYKVYHFREPDATSVAAFTGQSDEDGPGAPQNCPLITTWNARLVLAGRDKGPHIVHFSRVDDPNDWNTSITELSDVGKAISVSSIGAPITALIAHGRQCLIAGTLTSTWIFRGNPNVGTLDVLSPVVGPISAKAWCRDPYGRIYVLTRRGLYTMEGECGAPLIPVSDRKIPESLTNLDGVDNLAYLEYDTRFKMVHIYIQGTNSQYFHYFPETDSFWQVTSPGATIRAIGRYDLLDTADASGVLIGTSTNLKRLDRTEDLGGTDKAYAHIGPINLSKLGDKGFVSHASVKFGSNSDDTAGTVALYGAKDAESVVALPAGRKASTTVGKIISNHNNWSPRVGGQAGLLAITQVSTSGHISFEEAVLSGAPAGRERGA